MRTGKPTLLQEADRLRLFHSGEHPCGYWPQKTARDLVLDPRDPRLPQLYPMTLDWGFRRSGDLLYRPHCRGCRACVAVRLPVDRFTPDRSQRRCLARNADVQVRVLPAERTDEQLALYRRYLASRHAGAGMDGHGALAWCALDRCAEATDAAVRRASGLIGYMVGYVRPTMAGLPEGDVRDDIYELVSGAAVSALPATDRADRACDGIELVAFHGSHQERHTACLDLLAITRNHLERVRDDGRSAFVDGATRQVLMTTCTGRQ